MKNRKKEKGQAILEMAVMLPVFVLVSLALIDIQWSLERAANLDYIASETARCQAIGGILCTGANTPTTYANYLAKNLGMTVSDLTVVSSTCDSASCTDSMTYHFKPIGVWFPNMVIKRTGIASVVPAAGP